MKLRITVSIVMLMFILIIPNTSVHAASTESRAPHASCNGSGCDGLYPGPEGCITSRSLDLQHDNVYDSGGHLVGVMHFYFDQDCNAMHSSIWSGDRCTSGNGNGAQGQYNQKDQLGPTNALSGCSWLDTVMDEYNLFERCYSAWNGGEDDGRDGTFWYDHKLIYGGAGC